MKTLTRTLSVTATLALAAYTWGCSSDDTGNTVNSGDPTGGAGSGLGGSAPVGGSNSSGGREASGGTGDDTGGREATGGRSSEIPTAACKGAPYSGDPSDENTCRGVGAEVEPSPVDLFIMMDRTISMSYLVENSQTTRWEALRQAVEDFVTSPEVGDIRGGINFFNRSGGRNEDVDCDAENYIDPEDNSDGGPLGVRMGPLSENGMDLVDAIAAVEPGGLTPAFAAVEGGLIYAKQWAAANPERATVLVFVGDGYPTMCETDPALISDLIEDGYTQEPSIRTYAIGVGASQRFNLDNFARAGGTQEALMTEDDDVAAGFLDALKNITNEAVSCEWGLPEPPAGEALDYDEVQVIYEPFSGEDQEIPYVRTLSGCSASPYGGWYYDNPSDPTSIRVCPCTCTNLGAGTVTARIGCEPLTYIQ